MKLYLLTLLAMSFTLSANATFVPENEIDYGHLKSGPSNITEAEFREVIQKIKTAYQDVVKTHGGNLSINGDWKSEKLNAGATQIFSNWQVVISGALARRPELTADGLALIICHEVGHHLGGYSFTFGQNPLMGVWAANEGQSDYFATQVCSRKIWKNEKEKNATFRGQVPDFVKNRCDTAWSNTDEQDICYRTNSGVNSVIATMAALMNKPMPQFETPDPAVVDRTSDKHPAVQCRMDTSFQGSLCATVRNEAVIPGKKTSGGPYAGAAEQEALLNSCSQKSGQPFGFRPNCWFKSKY